MVSRWAPGNHESPRKWKREPQARESRVRGTGLALLALKVEEVIRESESMRCNNVK